MSTPTVAAETIALAKEEKLNLVTLPTWYDVDDVTSLLRLIEEIEGQDSVKAKQTRQFLLENQIHHSVNTGAGH